MIALVALALAGGAPPAARALQFEQVFATRGEPASLHFTAAFRSRDGVHLMELWRDGDRRVVRATDGAVLSYATRRPRDPGYALTVLDRRRRIRTDIDRDSLYRIGSFTEWFDLSHGLRHPRPGYRLIRLDDRDASARTAAPCRWYALTERDRSSRICWSAAYRLPMLIESEGRRLVWRVTRVDVGPIPAGRFAIDDRGYVRVNADRDIDGD